MMSRLVAMLCLVLLASISVAQEVTPPITAENADQLVPVQTVGSAMPGKLAFSPDGRHILASTSEQTYVYQAEQPTAAPQILPFTDFNFDAEARLVADGQYWNLDTGLSVGSAPTIRVLLPSDNQPNNLIEVVKPGGEIIQVDTGFPYQVLGTAVSDDYRVLAVVMRHTSRNQPALHLYDLSSGILYGIFPQHAFANQEKLFFIKGMESSLLLISETSFGQTDYDVKIYDAIQGMAPHYTGEINMRGSRSPNGKIVAYAVDRNRIVVLGDGILAEFPYIPTDDYLSPVYAVGNQHIAIVEDDGSSIKITGLLDQKVKIITLPFEKELHSSSFYFAQDDRWLAYKEISSAGYVWDLQTPKTPVIEIESGSIQTFNQDFTTYSAKTNSDKLAVRDIITDQTHAELPLDATLNETMSQALYWQEGQVILHDIVGDKSSSILVIDDYLGKVLAFNPTVATAAFADQQLILVNVSDATMIPVELSLPPDKLDFTKDGETFLVHRSFRGGDKPPGYLELRDTRSGEELRNFIGGWIAKLSKISPAGRYMLGDDVSYNCYALDEDPLSLALLSTSTTVVDRALIYVDATCGKNAVAFTSDDTIFYLGIRFNVLALNPDLVTDNLSVSSDDESGVPYSILAYTPRPLTTTNDYIQGLVLSPDERRIATIVESWKTNQVKVRAEIFNRADLGYGIHRADVQPLKQILNARMATFSPDGNSIVTDVGLFSLESGYQTEIVDGTISAFTSDSRLLATYQDGYVNLWSVNYPSSLTFPIAQYPIEGVSELAFSPDNRYLYIVREGDVQMWGVK